MIVTLYTSRVVLNVLGTNDYGIYQTVGGIVGMMSFINNSLATGSSRFLTFELGKEDKSRLKAMFSSLMTAHVVLAVLMVLIGEPLGLWYIDNKLNIPPEQITTAKIIYQFSLITAVMNITQVPFSSVIIAHENMKIYAYVSLLETALKLVTAFAISISPVNKLILYAALLCLSQLVIRVIYRMYCGKNYPESRFDWRIFDKNIMKDVLSFSSWSMFANISSALIKNGTVMMLTQFFSPALAASRAVADQVNGTINQFITNFRTAANPQIVKRFASKDYEGSKSLLLKSTCFSYYLMLFISVPVILLAEPLIQLWLGQTPEYVVPFLQWTMVQSLISVFDSSFYVPLYAKGRLRENALIAPGIDVICLCAVYLCFKNGSSPMVICYTYVIMALLQGMVEKPVLLCLIVDYRVREILGVFVRCLLVSVLAIPLPVLFAANVDTFRFVNFILVCVVSCISSGLAVWLAGMTKEDRSFAIGYVKKILGRVLASKKKNGEIDHD